MTRSLLEINTKTVPNERLNTPAPKQKRKLGVLKNKASVKFADDFEISPDKMLGL
ncbi:hypothetical protein SAMN05720766_10264 [Fibrobacter sp. UWH9]|nr:hypothetical protein SAMN05720766_10264 [Fibrobacter sp. UWH9]